MLRIKRVYEKESSEDGYRILVDRLWPRGESKEEANVDYWVKEIAPSTKLRKEFGHTPERFEEFKIKYIEELDTNEKTKQLLDLIRGQLKLGDVTLLYAAKNEEMNNAVVLRKWLEKYL